MNKMCRIIAIGVLGAMAALPGIAAAASIGWDLTGHGGNLGHAETFVGTDGAKVRVKAYSFASGQGWQNASIYQSAFGLGVISPFGAFDNPQVDNFRSYDLLRFDLRQIADPVEAVSMLLTFGFTNDDYVIWGNNTGNRPGAGSLNGSILSSGRLSVFPAEEVVFSTSQPFDYLFIGGDLQIFNGLGGLLEADGFKVAQLGLTTVPDVSEVPVPGALPLLASALALLGLAGRRRRPLPGLSAV